ncbi:ATP-binding cassette domain-containing protein [Methanospirillum hungatei]|mgnify:FL=1|jgi:ABC-2 type transport system ATP-binding protein|uniref:ATP-binding cassette domain-containing protein n=1 Tax=Methanospirillum hungatei TaxID=2203 RepID=UPI001B426DCF|nr:ATP-binding cassette domain-containing protein [Methanospirillum hungatei]MBP9007350.1 ATP-binding cassette domain-containing protein [Methanospirillum sp.]HOW05872.1 ATP-binding cassette domain-containing protein [Methanospirillum hungatei]
MAFISGGLSCILSWKMTTGPLKYVFMVQEGEVFGLRGPNGSGKTTLVRLLNGVLTPTSGRAYVFGKDVTTDGSWIRARTGVLTETTSLYERLTAKKNLSFFRRFYGIPDAEIPTDDYPLPSALIYGYSKNRLLHIFVVFNKEENEIIVITTYEPDEIHFDPGKKRRPL